MALIVIILGTVLATIEIGNTLQLLSLNIVVSVVLMPIFWISMPHKLTGIGAKPLLTYSTWPKLKMPSWNTVSNVVNRITSVRAAFSPSLGYKRPEMKLWIIAIMMAAGWSIVVGTNYFFEYVFQQMGAGVSYSMFPFETYALHQWVAFFVLSVIIAPYIEELIFRQFLIKYLLRKYRGYAVGAFVMDRPFFIMLPDVRPMSPIIAIGVTSLAFAVMHHPTIWVAAFMMGLMLGGLRLFTGSLWPCFVMHSLNNAIVFAFNFYEYQL